VPLLARAVRDKSDGEQIRAVEEAHAVLEAEALPSQELPVDAPQPGRTQT
jgi:hypothetical protein